MNDAPRHLHDGPPVEDLLRGKKVVMFDGECVLCSGFARFVLRFDRKARFRLASMQSVVGQRILAHLGLPLSDWDSNLVIEDGTPYFKSTAYIRIMTGLGAPWSWIAIGRIVPQPIRDWLYDRIARNRYRLFGRHASCMVPTPDIADRFL